MLLKAIIEKRMHSGISSFISKKGNDCSRRA